MDGHVTDDLLLVYYLGASADDDRARIDAHLCACPACLRAFLDLKRHVERGLRPRPAVRERLRADVRAAFRPTAAGRLRRALRHPIPLYQGLAAAALAVAVVSLLPLARGLAPRDGARPATGARVDSARLSPESLTIY